jgi:hypothetical protein
MPARDIDALLTQIQAVALELHQLEGDGLDGIALTPRRAELRRLKSRLADLVSHDRSLVAA